MNTNHQIFTRSLLLSGLALAGCVDVDAGGEAPELAVEGEKPERADEAIDELAAPDDDPQPVLGSPSIACQSRNVGGILTDPEEFSCDLGGALVGTNWTWEPTFGDSTPDLAAWDEPRPLELQKFCSFQFVGPDLPQTSDYFDLFTEIDAYPGMLLSEIGVDCRGYYRQGDLNDPALADELESAFESATNWMSGTLIGQLSSAREEINVSIVDTISGYAAAGIVSPIDEHGKHMGDIVGKIACADGDANCLDNVHYNVALVRQGNEYANYAHGGSYAGQFDVAQGILAAVVGTRSRWLGDQQSTLRNTILLSIGWQMIDEPNGLDPIRAPYRAVETVLKYAACNGHIVVAAAGNVSDPACKAEEIGQLAPASFSTTPAPTEAECEALGFLPLDDENFPVHSGEDRPLVYAIGGVTGSAKPLANARKDSTPPLTAYGSDYPVVLENSVPSRLTGTSVSTAVVAGIAALVWSLDPTLTPDEVMDHIYDSGQSVGTNADVYLGLVSSPVKRASVCHALSSVCATLPGGTCPPFLCASTVPPAHGYLDSFFAAADAAINNAATHGVFEDLGAGKPTTCQLNLHEQTEPQPLRNICPHCGVEIQYDDGIPDNDTLDMSIEAQYQGDVHMFLLTTEADDGATLDFEYYDEAGNDDPVDSVNQNEVTTVLFDAPTTVVADLTIQLVDGTIFSGPLPVNVIY